MVDVKRDAFVVEKRRDDGKGVVVRGAFYIATSLC